MSEHIVLLKGLELVEQTSAVQEGMSRVCRDFEHVAAQGGPGEPWSGFPAAHRAHAHLFKRAKS